MRALAGFIMRGRSQAVLVASLGALLPGLIWVSGAVIALFALRKGWREGLLIIVFTAGVCALGLTLLGGLPQQVLRPALELWLPVLLVAGWLRASVSLSSTLQLLAGLGVLTVLGLYLLVPEPEAYWAAQFEQMRQLLEVGEADWAMLREQIVPIMSGLWAVNLMLLVLIGLLLGRWWQALLFNPGGFRQEFHGLRLDWRLAVLALALWVASAFTGPGLVNDLGLVLSGIFLFQGLSLIHAVGAARDWGRGWFVLLYVLLPLILQILMAVGMGDAIFNWRRRLMGSDGGPSA
ncbi:hypothetical protein [Alkalilimnicola sp. S0819]|uniref:hypothetical protein n=1 Tax=Alkalilimnicola sp. S0819 TaxID=2613922 RepID=UPI0012623F53|nr:hypothetical protein [Alkalilimnicola sp. S0819]KAB7628364.1 hypothetical protein F3N43_01270 [Alkalilimnicola sp. S0819]MPQ15266.1 hypothetical protein [Alkalilimnicola sp. S0819]